MSSATPIVDHDQVRQWIERHNGRPAHVVGTAKGEDPGMLTIKFDHLHASETAQNEAEVLPWDRWLRWFDKNRLALVVSHNGFNKLVPR